MAPIGPAVRVAIDRIRQERPGIGAAPLFPSPGDATRPVSGYFATKLLKRAIRLADARAKERGSAGFAVPKGWGFHSFRRKFATELKHMPDTDVAALGGWKGVDTLRMVYQQADQATMLQALLGRAELREAR